MTQGKRCLIYGSSQISAFQTLWNLVGENSGAEWLFSLCPCTPLSGTGQPLALPSCQGPALRPRCCQHLGGICSHHCPPIYPYTAQKWVEKCPGQFVSENQNGPFRAHFSCQLYLVPRFKDYKGRSKPFYHMVKADQYTQFPRASEKPCFIFKLYLKSPNW